MKGDRAIFMVKNWCRTFVSFASLLQPNMNSIMPRDVFRIMHCRRTETTDGTRWQHTPASSSQFHDERAENNCNHHFAKEMLQVSVSFSNPLFVLMD
jgi:hypothetical protein